MVKNPPAMQGTWVLSLGWEDPLEKGKATYSSILAWRIPWTEEPGGLQSRELHRVRHDGSDSTRPSTRLRRRSFDLWARKIPLEEEMAPHSSMLAGESHGQRSLVGDSPRGCKGIGHTRSHTHTHTHTHTC